MNVAETMMATSASGILFLAVQYAHLIGFALVLGGVAAQYLAGRYRVNAAVLAGAVVWLLAGFAHTILLRRVLSELGYPPVGDRVYFPFEAGLVIRLLLALVVAVMVYAVRTRDSVPRPYLATVGGLLLLDAALAVFLVPLTNYNVLPEGAYVNPLLP